MRHRRHHRTRDTGSRGGMPSSRATVHNPAMARNPRTGSPVEVSARPVPVFKPSKELRAMVAGIDGSQLEDEEELSEA